jgi:hypothetical protein
VLAQGGENLLDVFERIAKDYTLAALVTQIPFAGALKRKWILASLGVTRHTDRSLLQFMRRITPLSSRDVSASTAKKTASEEKTQVVRDARCVYLDSESVGR